MNKEIIERVKEVSLLACEDLDYKLINVSSYFEDGEEYIRIEVDYHFETTMDHINTFQDHFFKKMNEVYPDYLDETILQVCSLDICSGGAIREVDLDDLKYLHDFYLKVRTDKETKGNLVSFDETSLTLKTNNKGKIKNVTINFTDIKQIFTDIK